MTSVDIVVSEPYTTPVGYSLQLAGAGMVYEDFLGPQHRQTPLTTSTPAKPLVVAWIPNVIINEVDSDTPGDDVLEFIELYDGGTGNTALDGLVVVYSMVRMISLIRLYLIWMVTQPTPMATL